MSWSSVERGGVERGEMISSSHHMLKEEGRWSQISMSREESNDETLGEKKKRIMLVTMRLYQS